MRLAASVILYKHDDTIYRNISSYIQVVDKMLVFDNSENPNFDQNLIHSDKIVYYSDRNNQGIAHRLNQAILYCINNNYSHLLTMDQDSSFTDNAIANYIQLIKDNNDINIGMYGVCYDETCKVEHAAINEILITSGSIINISLAEKIGNFDENIFIDGVDTDFCIRLFQNEYKTILYHKIKIKHSLGETKKVITPYLKKSKRAVHSSTRIYYLIRNNLYLRVKHPNHHHCLKWGNILNEIKNALLYGDERAITIRAIFAARKDFKNKCFGKLIQS